ncbi:MAG: hypothetical protein A2Z32_00180 [Chloroflexi bacterium RBG_16_69_14]|nr:MAG: hypothetical protein A2Z32_00180 [Chloroflexi bacterium RBG_16_69_14]
MFQWTNDQTPRPSIESSAARFKHPDRGMASLETQTAGDGRSARWLERRVTHRPPTLGRAPATRS